MRVTCLFDVEDYVTPPEGELDDLVGMLAQVMTEQRISGSMFVIGEKARCLRRRGREDVISAMARHDIGSHVNMGSIHPTLTERAEHADWTNGLSRMVADEFVGVEEISDIFGRPLSSLARHGGSFCPQLLAALGTRGLSYVYSPAQLPGHHITWYCNTLNYAGEGAVFQEAYHSREAFLQAEKRFYAAVEKNEECEWLALFNSHPCHIKTKSFICSNYAHGLNPPLDECVAPDFYPEFAMQTVRDNWSFHCARLRDDPDLTVGTIAEFNEEFGRQAEEATKDELMSLAGQAAEAESPLWTDRFSAAEILDLLARAYLRMRAQGALPDSLPRRKVFGPSQMPLSCPTAMKLEPLALWRAARGIDVAVETVGVLPSHIRCAEGSLGSRGEIGPGTAMAALGQVITRGDLARTVRPKPVAPYPPEGDEIADRVRQYGHWMPHRQDLDMEKICRLAALQSWTLKPAWPGEPPVSVG